MDLQSKVAIVSGASRGIGRQFEANVHAPFGLMGLFDETIEGGVERFVALMRSQGSYQALRRLGLSDDTLGMSAFEQEVGAAFARALTVPALSFSWRARIGVRSSPSPLRQGSSSA